MSRGDQTRRVWTLRGASTEYTVAVPEVPEHGRWLELVAWGPHGVSDGPSPVGYDGPTPFLTAGDAAPIEYATDANRPFTGPDLVVETATGDRRVSWRWSHTEADADQRQLTVGFADPVTGLRAVIRYEIPAGTDVVRRWVELTNDGPAPLRLVRAGSAGFCVPTPHGARLSYQWGQWAQEFQLDHVDLGHGGFTIGSAQGVPGHLYVPWLAVRDNAEPDGPTWGMALAWTGSWEITADRDTGGLTRVRVGRNLPDGPLDLPAGASLTLPVAAGAYSPDGLDGLARVWHTYQRQLAGERLSPRPVLYNSWEATYFAVDADNQLALARIAADLGVETFVVDDGWFVGRPDDHGGLGDWTPDPAKFPAGFDNFVKEVRALGLNFGLWVEPECVSPRSKLYAEHPDWVYAIDGRPITPVRNQYLLDLGRPEVAEFVHSTVDGLLRRHDIGYLKWDFNRPRTEPGRGGAGGRVDLDGAHVANLHRIYRDLRRDHPHVVIEACAGGGARTDLAMAALSDVFWPSDNTGPLDRLAIQYGFLHANAPHLLSSWVTDSPGLFDPRPRSLAFRFVLAMAGVLGIGADIRHWSPEQRTEAAAWIARYKEIREIVMHGTVHLIGGPDQSRCAVQYTSPDGGTVVVLAWHTGRLDGAGLLPSRPVRLPLRGLDPAARYRHDERHYSGSHLQSVGLPVHWTATHDAELAVLQRV
ncbi:alpha-galactosidase [Micromonospora sp. NBC_01796]|uniref:alpha-galactosidase n=1 Tax=Micromonospora sp. NBC_01796 TaxID=2975987 RepID=UPI002DDBF65C|nr:alpha-galactosidase [Micromonospora sp. NBC_01796]WSA85511.1 alpha-galactosidase [Micromonospora sp. NBC_01796]